MNVFWVYKYYVERKVPYLWRIIIWDDSVDVISGQCITHLQVAVCQHVCLHTHTHTDKDAYIQWIETIFGIYTFAHTLTHPCTCVCVCMSDGSICCTTAVWLEPQWLSDRLCSTPTVLSCWMFWVPREESSHDSYRELSSWLICVTTHTHALYALSCHTQGDVCVHARTSRLRVCHSSLERLLGLVLLPVSIVARAE